MPSGKMAPAPKLADRDSGLEADARKHLLKTHRVTLCGKAKKLTILRASGKMKNWTPMLKRVLDYFIQQISLFLFLNAQKTHVIKVHIQISLKGLFQ